MRVSLLASSIVAIAGLDLYALSSRNALGIALALAAVAALFAAGYDAARGRSGPPRASAPAALWNAPLATMLFDARDRWNMAGLAIASFALSVVRYWVPPDKIFDEVYFARAAEEYLRNQRIYENTHPPLTKLIVTLSVMLFGGLAHGDSSYGWRFLDVVFSALAVALLYALARRVTGSWVWALAAAGFLLFDGMHFVQSRIATPEGIVICFSLATAYALFRFWTQPAGGRATTAWLFVFGIALGALVGSKWYGLTFAPLAAGLLLWQRPKGVRALPALGTIAAVALAAYALVWVPDLVRQSPDPNEIHSIGDVFVRQYDMFHYHATLRATHPYSSKWWEWPLDAVPVAYYYTPAPSPTPASCCVREITSMPNPLTLWFGILSLPAVAALAWRERNRSYAFAVLLYLAQWLPWALSPRISWEYHYYVDIPIVCLCNAIALQRLWGWASALPRYRSFATPAVAAYAAAVVGLFFYFYPILAAVPIAWGDWNARMWFPTWIIGPG